MSHRQPMPRWLKWGLALIGIAVAVGLVMATVGDARAAARCSTKLELCIGDTISGTVIKPPHDGDTIEVGAIDVRLAGIDAPEIAPPPRAKRTAANRNGQPLGDLARHALAALVLGKPVTVTVVALDAYGRAVGRVTVPDQREPGKTIDVNLLLLANGLGQIDPRYPPGPEFDAAQAEAQANRRGIWSQPVESQEPPANWRACQLLRSSCRTWP